MGPVSNFASWFNKPFLEKELIKNKIKYRYAGKLLGGRPDGNEFYDNNGHALYNKMAESMRLSRRFSLKNTLQQRLY